MITRSPSHDALMHGCNAFATVMEAVDRDRQIPPALRTSWPTSGVDVTGCCAGNYFPSSTSDEVQPTPAVSNLSVAPRRDGRRAFFGLIASHCFPSPALAPPQQASAFFVPLPPVKNGNGFVQHPSAKPSRRPSSPHTSPRVKLSASPRPHSTRGTPHLVI